MRKIPIPTEAKHHNQLKGEILKDLISINTVEHINLSYNALTGKISQELLTHNSLKYLYLNNNQLTGNIPNIQKSNYDDDSKILAINIAHNKLTGSIPQSIDRLFNIETLCLNIICFQNIFLKPLEIYSIYMRYI